LTSRRTKACAISRTTKIEVYERDGGLCIFCGRPGLPNAHVVARSHGGLGVPENIITACPECHRRMDNTPDRNRYINRAIEYLKGFYTDWSREKVTYKK
jgi:5-methylcytosine-specific restriction endonuclease McrA